MKNPAVNQPISIPQTINSKLDTSSKYKLMLFITVFNTLHIIEVRTTVFDSATVCHDVKLNRPWTSLLLFYHAILYHTHFFQNHFLLTNNNSNILKTNDHFDTFRQHKNCIVCKDFTFTNTHKNVDHLILTWVLLIGHPYWILFIFKTLNAHYFEQHRYLSTYIYHNLYMYF